MSNPHPIQTPRNGGRPVGVSGIRSAARRHYREMIDVLAEVARDKSAPAADRRGAAAVVIDLAAGKIHSTSES